MRYLLIVVSFFSFLSCGNQHADKIVGKWQTSEILEDGVPLEVDLNEIGFEFFKNGYYHFTSTINYEEAGTYYLDGPYLYTMDTVNTASSEKAVKITALTQDSLVLLMSVKGKEKIMKLSRKR